MTSEALAANLARTAVPVVIPPEHRVLLEITEPWVGIHDSTELLLREVHHRYAGWSQTLNDLHRRAMADFTLYDAHDRGPVGLRVFGELYGKVAGEATTRSIRADALRLWLVYVEKLAAQAGESFERNLPALRLSVNRIGRTLQKEPELAPGGTPGLSKLVSVLLAQPGDGAASVLDQVAELAAFALGRLYRQWLATEDLADSYRAASRLPDTDLPEAVSRLSHAHLEQLLVELRVPTGDLSSRERAAAFGPFPDGDELMRTALEVADLFDDGPEGAVGRIRWLLGMLGRETLAPVHERALREASRSCSKALRGADSEEREQLLRSVFSVLRRGMFPQRRSALALISRLGRDVLGEGDPELAEVLFDELLRFDFDYPEFSGFTEEWAARVNPGHLQHIRAYVAMIEADPALARPLLAALVIHLKVGGVFMADTDLFQRDISSLLRGDIRSVYVQVKHLLRLFPVYFSEIGAEGALRDVSTRIDELRGRRDPLCHFLRKQSHVECNPQLASLVEEIARFWATGDAAPLRDYLPASVYEQVGADEAATEGMRALFEELAATEGGLGALFALAPSEIEARIDGLSHPDSPDLERAKLLFRLRREITRKYELDYEDLVERLRTFGRLDGEVVNELEQSLAQSDSRRALELVIRVLEELQLLILREGETNASEDIYRKRHIAVGIPSMYGSYREERFEAMGLTFRAESLAAALFGRLLAEERLTPIDRETLTRLSGWLHLLLRALRVDGFRAQGPASCLAMLDEAIAAPDTAVWQFLDIFQLLSRSIESMIGSRILDVYEKPARHLIRRMIEQGLLPLAEDETVDEAVLKRSEAFLRDLIAGSFGLQRLDLLTGEAIRALRGAEASTEPRRARSLSPGRLGRCVVPIAAENGRGDGILALGNKGFMLRHLTELGFPVPDGFVLTTELSWAGGVARLPRGSREELMLRIRRELRRLERLAGARFGDPARPLLLSVRGGAPISMPGVLSSFLDVGISEEIVEGMASHRGSPWGAWDAYRRFLQFWGMSHGIERDRFDGLIADAKTRAGVPKKALLPAAAMRELAFQYRSLLLDRGTPIPEDPFEQLVACIDLVFRSWSSDNARAYRQELRIAEEWGTAAIVQTMVFGNLGARSGTGVAFTHHPHRSGDLLELYGDFAVQSQGDDVVSGLVETNPISERQRAETGGAHVSLEGSFPRIYEALLRSARSLVHEHGMNHQEIEFTFESDTPTGLYLLQTRDTVVAPVSTVAAFEPTVALVGARLAAGIGVSGGALSGRVAYTPTEIAAARERFPGEAVILLRRDTVPDDLRLVLEADGLLTAIGGATSHAAVTAKRLGKTCVVGCRALELDDSHGRSRIGDRPISSGDLLSINGMDGSVYLGAHPVTMVQVGGRV